METLNGRAVIEQFWRTACAGARAAGLKRTVHIDDVESADRLGCVRGTVVLRQSGEASATTVRYVTVWRREADGMWRLATDISCVAPAAAGAAREHAR